MAALIPSPVQGGPYKINEASNMTAADAYYDRASAILRQGQMIKLKTLRQRRLLFQKQAA
jgi:hypothetical protein